MGIQYNMFDLIPHTIRSWEENEDKTVYILYPRYPCWPFRWLARYSKHPYIHLKLDSVGSHIWKHIDGKKRVMEISQIVGNLLQQEINEAWHNRVAYFMAYLQRGDLIQLKNHE